ncbi:TIGR04222 domain-containing membrane protein [Streptomyces sp. NPDC126499]|uniref:TIGR04222 domain-containing membrane protein n=1 Tax=Streptomyces sp. NPDC126499 TaxID=3155314 RepID=UPI00331A36EC
MLWVPLLLVALAVSGLACARVCRDAVAADTVTAGTVAPEAVPTDAGHPRQGLGDRHGHNGALTLREVAYLAGGPPRVADLGLVALHRSGRVLLARTGWVTVVDATGGRDDLERAVLGAIGPTGQARIREVRPRVAGAESVRALGDGLVTRGLALPEAERRATAAGARGVRVAFLLTLALGTGAALLVSAQEREQVVAWFSLPLVAAGLCALIARTDGPGYGCWASPAGRRLLARLGAGRSATDPLTAVARRGTGVLEPDLRAAFRGHDSRHPS